MKKLILLLFIPLVFTCSSDSSDDSQEDQTFLEKHNGIVWETSPESNVTYIQRFMFTNNPKSISYYFEDGDSESCTTDPIASQNENCSNCWIIYENSNNTVSYTHLTLPTKRIV